MQNYYLYCCYQMGTVWGFRYENGRVHDHRVLAHSTYHCASWGRDHAGELYLVALSGEIFRLQPNPAAKEGMARFPQRLSETGLFASVPDERPAPGVIPYSVNAPGWHDGASMTRLLAVPNADTINPNANRGWDFMDGAVLVQTLSLEMEKGKSGQSQESRDPPVDTPGGRMVWLFLCLERFADRRASWCEKRARNTNCGFATPRHPAARDSKPGTF